MIVTSNQRWRDQRDSYRQPGELFDPSRHEVAPIDSDKVARGFVRQHHYSGSYPAARRRFGLYRDGHELAGVTVFSVAQNNATYAGLPGSPEESLDLGRFVMLDKVEYNGETWFLKRCFDALRAEGFVTVVSFSDPARRTNATGDIVFGGHVGTIYQASNAVYLGTSKAETKRVLPDGLVIPGRSLTKVRHRRQGFQGTVDRLVSYGAVPLRADEDAVAWVARWLDRLTRKLRHPGNFKYVFGLNRRAKKHLPESLPYPKLQMIGATA